MIFHFIFFLKKKKAREEEEEEENQPDGFWLTIAQLDGYSLKALVGIEKEMLSSS